MTPTPLHIFKPGRHTAMSGATLQFSEAALKAAASAYDPARHEAPLVVGHPRHDLPAYGWVQSLQYSDGADGHEPGLYALPAQVNPDFADMVAAGAFKKISASFYSPDAPNNPAPGHYYLRHVGFLGAQAPAVKGLQPPKIVNYSDAEAGVLTFGEWDDVDNASLWRGLRDWFIGKFGQAEADTVIPGYKVQSLEQGAQDELREAQAESSPEAVGTSPAAPAFADPAFPPPEPPVTPEEKAALEAENARLRAELARQRQAAVHQDHIAFCEGLVSQGFAPAWREFAVATLDHFAAEPLEFGEGDERKPMLDAFKDFLKGLPPAVRLGEQITTGQAAEAVDFSDPESIAAAAHVYQLQAEQAGRPVSYAHAVAQVASTRQPN